MVKYPIVLIVSEGRETPENIINNIRKIPSEENTEPLLSDSSSDLIGYVYELTTKYYKTNLFLVPFNEDLALLPSQVQDGIEGLLIYFDSGKRNFSTKIPTYADFLKDNDIELGILLCDRLYDDPNEGVTYKDAKQQSKFLDVIELSRTRDEDEEEDLHDPVGYDELLQALRSFLWSNVEVNSAAERAYRSLNNDTGSSGTASCADTPQGEENSIESELASFETLLTEMMMFKNTTSSWSRNERLAYAQKFADKFDELIGDEGNGEA